MSYEVAVTVRPGEITDLVDEHEVRDLATDIGERVARTATGLAPRRTGAGATSIHAEVVMDHPNWEVRAGWDRLHRYMYFHEVGTEHMRPAPFLVPSLEGL